METENEVLKAIRERHSVRRFIDKPLPAGALDEICRAAMCAPSACNQQMWEFVVVTARERLDALAALMPNAHMLAQAQAAIVVCGAPGEKYGFYWQQDCSAATQNALLAVHALGLGACWCGLYPREERAAQTAQLLGIPAEIIPMALLAVGVPDPSSGEHAKDKWKPEKIHREQW